MAEVETLQSFVAMAKFRFLVGLLGVIGRPARADGSSQSQRVSLEPHGADLRNAATASRNNHTANPSTQHYTSSSEPARLRTIISL